MPIDPRLLSPAAAPPEYGPDSPAEITSRDIFVPAGRLRRSIPNLGHTFIFLAMILFALLLTSLALSGLLRKIPAFHHETVLQMESDPRIVVPLEVAMYTVAGLFGWGVFPLIWHRPFLTGLHWCGSVVRRRWAPLVITGVVLSVAIQFLSHYLPIPKDLPIEKFFQNPVGVWLLAIFGVTVAPAFEELFFRGFLLPSLASAWDWVARRSGSRDLAVLDTPMEDEMPLPSSPASSINSLGFPVADEHWSTPAIIFASIVTSIGFALLHAGQLAHALAPLSVLFCVSLVLCFVRIRTHSFAASTLVHAVYNATIFTLLFIGTGGFRHLDKMNN